MTPQQHHLLFDYTKIQKPVSGTFYIVDEDFITYARSHGVSEEMIRASSAAQIKDEQLWIDAAVLNELAGRPGLGARELAGKK